MKIDGDESSEREMSPDSITVGIAEYEVTTDGTVLTTSGLGSCIGVVIYDESVPAAGLVHVMLPSADKVAGGNRAKFADSGVELLIEALEAVGSDPDDMVAKIAGGSDMFDFSEGGSGIGERNAETAHETLEDYGIPVVGQDIGGDHGRSLRLEGASGKLVVESANKDSRTL